MARKNDYISTYSPEGSFGEVMLVAARWYRDELDRALRPVGYSYANLEPLFILERSHPIFHSTLARASRVRGATLVPLLDRLVADGYVTKTESAKDRRRILLEITPAGRDFAYQCRLTVAAVAKAVFEGVSREALSPANYVVAFMRVSLEKRVGRESRG